MVNTDKNKIEELLSRGVENIYPSKDFLHELLQSGKQITVYLGIDPTGPTLHIGHVIQLLKLRAFQELGHHIILLIGDFTATIGDPTDKAAARVILSRQQVLENARLYKDQASHIINFSGDNPASIKYNSDWLAKMSFADLLTLASKMTFAQTIKRDMFQKRIKEDKDLYLNEFLYPLLQGYDSVAMDVDGEIGGSDQTFNMLMGRDLMKKMKNREKFVITTKILTDSSGAKMGKTTGNMISVADGPEEMFGKIMNWADTMIFPGFELCTFLSMNEIEIIKKHIASGGNPKDAKMRLAESVTSIFHGTKAASLAKEGFIKTFSDGVAPENIVEVEIDAGGDLREVLLREGLVSSKNNFRQLLEEGAMSFDREKINDPLFKLTKSGVIRVGKKRFLKIIVK